MDLQFESLAEFFAMGGHALYVWLAYGATIIVLLGNFFMLRIARQRQIRELRWHASLQTDVSDAPTRDSEADIK